MIHRQRSEVRYTASAMDPKAFTLIEMLVAVGTIAILVAIILPAVSAARESARRIRCANNLKQIGLACVNYSQAFGVYPIAGEIDATNPHIALLPFLEQNAMFESFNFAAAGSVLLYSNVTAMRTQVDTYLCPSDRIRVESAATNYAVNDHFDPRSRRRIGPFQGMTPIRPEQVRDGLSRTAFFSEFLIGVQPYLTRSRGQQVNTNDRRRPLFAINIASSAGEPLEAAEPACQNAGFDDVVHTDSKGLSWWIGQRPNSGYDHNFVPDTPACAMFFEESRFDGYFIPVSSDHFSVIQVSFGDGHVASIRKSIDSKVWRAIGSISGGEPISDNDY